MGTFLMLTTSESGRPLYGQKDLGSLLAPRSVVVVGASERPGSFGGQVLRNALTSKLDVSVVNPRATSILGVPAAPSLAAVDRAVDVAAVCVPQAAVLDSLRDVVSLGIPSAIVYSSGFAETGRPEGIAAQEQLAEICASGLRVLGPNSLGYINFWKGIELEFVPAYGEELRPGGIGVIAQSGALGYLLTQAQFRGVGFAHWAAAGNSCDVDSLDLTNFMLEDPNTRCVVLVLESVKDGARIFEVGRRAAELGKPVIVYKMGDSERGGRAAQSHTAALAGSAEVTRRVFRDAGLVVVDHFDELIGTANLFAKYGRARSRGIGVISASGGATIIGADEAELSGVDLPALASQTVTALDTILPAFASAANPADLTAEMVKNVPAFEECLRTFRRDENLALIVMSLSAASEGITGARAPVIGRVAAEEEGAPISIIWFSEWLTGPGALEIESHPNIAMFRSARIAMTAIRKWLAWSFADGPAAGDLTGAVLDAETREAARYVESCLAAQAGSPGMRYLDEVEGKRALNLLGIRTSTPVVVDARSPMDSWDELTGLGFPAVVKVLDRAVLHKARVGGVRLNVANPQEALGTALEMGARLATDTGPASTIVETMAAGRAEWFVGARRDVAFGVVATIGIGGGDVESRRPVLIVGSPSAAEIARRLTADENLVGLALAGRPELVTALSLVATKLSAIFDAVPSLTEVDVNPLLETADGLIAVDAVMIATP
jgi:acyl-CoA synthetase (NDP forming)